MFCNRSRKNFRRNSLYVAVSAIIASTPVAFISPVSAQEDVSDIESITVTASRIRRDGYSAPTPVSVLTEDAIRSVAPVDISEALALMPQFNTSSQPSTAVQYANLRNIGAERTLLLLDGRRHVPTFSSGVVDLTTIPTAMISRSEIVTGGASASWGSDAVSGVVNLILRDDLEGIVGNAQYGESSYGDDETQSVSLAGGMSIADGRGHILVGGEYANADGIGPFIEPGVSRTDIAGRGSVSNSDYSAGPQYIYSDDVRRADVHNGGLITSGPLAGTTFLPNGATGEFGYGELYRNNMIGGSDNKFDGPEPGGQIKAPYERQSFLGRLTYQLTDNVEGVLEYNYSESLSNGESILGRNQGSVGANRGCTTAGYNGPRFGNINVPIDNAFLPQSVRDDMVAAGIDCFNFGRSWREQEMGFFKTSEGSPEIHRYVAALSGEFSNGWTWDGYWQYGDSSFQQRRGGNIHSIRFQAAVDSVLDTSGNIVCRVNIDSDPANDDPACVPFNMFGQGSPSLEAQRYVTGTSRLDQDIEQTVAAFNVRGDLFDGPAGPIAAAFGYEYRQEEIYATVDADSELNRWQTSNRKGIEGDYDLNEFYAEVAIPLVADAQMADAVDLNLAVRSTDYSSSGQVTTWKAGATWDINPQLRFRISESRDIRAGNLGELFTPTDVDLRNITNPDTSESYVTQIVTQGNPALDPEEADTFTAGVVVSPDFLEGFQASIDYYSIDIEGMIGTLSGQDVINQCYIQDLQRFCERLTIDGAGAITNIDNSYNNLDRFETSGVDIVASYSTPLAGGNLNIRVSSTYVEESITTFLTDGSLEDSAGEFGNPHWKAFWNVGYQQGNFGVNVDWRWYGGGKLSNQRIEGFFGPQGANINDIGSVHYTGLNFTYDLSSMLNNQRSTVFLRIDNVFDQEPPFPLRSAFNDNYGRGFKGGIQFEF